MSRRSSELDRIARLAAAYGEPPAGVERGIGDDAAVLRAPEGKRLVWTIDAQVEGVHFRTELLERASIGYRATMAAASDVAAMGAAPWCMLSSVALPAELDDDAFDAIASGVARAATELGAPVVGGNLSRASELSITTTVLGACERAVPRDGARAGDRVMIAGAVGLAAAGLVALQRGAHGAELAPCVEAWRHPRARVADGLRMASVARAAIDVSDGLARDLGHVARASGVRVVLRREALLAHAGQALGAAARALSLDPLDCILHGGEDYALVIAAPADVDGFVPIGVVEEGEGIFLASGENKLEIDPLGFDHFAARKA